MDPPLGLSVLRNLGNICSACTSESGVTLHATAQPELVYISQEDRSLNLPGHTLTYSISVGVSANVCPIMVPRQSLRSSRPRGRSLLSIDKNYARRIDTLYKKAFEAPGAIADENLRSRCRLAVIQELDGVCSIFLTHNDASWPPSREDLKVSELSPA